MPIPKSAKIMVSDHQAIILERISRQTTSSVREVERSRMLLEISKGLSNTKIAAGLGITQERVKRWRLRWLSFEAVFGAMEKNGGEHLLRELEVKIRECLSDAPRSGAPMTFTAEQYCQIVGIALEAPSASGRPISEWTPREIADEAAKRGIVKSISKSQVRVFLKGKRPQTA
ncbi:MAG: helix-turn-helix domain-containing protein [Saprospiraceae bacterium]|nr:helix-turn-helix domain-containing protein [Saprospiraceae bacterium]